MTIKKTVGILSAITAICCLILTFLYVQLYNAFLENKLAVQQELALTILVTELSVSSTELTNFVRMYAVTGRPQAEQDYKKVLAARNGKISRNASRRVAPNEKVTLTDLMIRYGCTKEELKKVALASKLSDELVALETEALYAVKGFFKAPDGTYTIKKTPDNAYAMNLVFSREYQDEVAKIQRPLLDFLFMVNKRIHETTERANAIVSRTIILLGITIGLVFLLAISFAWYTYYKICQPLMRAAAFVKKVANSEFSK